MIFYYDTPYLRRTHKVPKVQSSGMLKFGIFRFDPTLVRMTNYWIITSRPHQDVKDVKDIIRFDIDYY